ncbi:MAG: glycosyltransferase [Rhodospirillales bacterium]
MSNKPRILMTNNYDMPLQRQLWLEDGGRRPNHHLWATVQLEAAGYPTSIIPFDAKSALARLSDACKIFGDLGQQWYALTHMAEYDVLYAAHQNPLLLLALCRRLGLFPKPIISVLHRSYGRSRAARLFVTAFLRGYDTLMTVTREIATAMRTNGRWSDARLTALPWGLDVPAFDRAIEGVATDTGENRHFMSTGKTNRDFHVLVEAFRQVPGAALRVYHGTDNAAAMAARDAARALGDAGANMAFRQLNFNDWREIARINKQAYAILIALDLESAAPYANGFGLTALLDAMAAGRPIIITRTAYPVIDVEAEGIGVFVNGADPAAWTAAVRRLSDDPEAAEEMGRRARRLCESTYNIETYAAGVMHRIDRVTDGVAAPRAISPIHG